MKKRTTLIDYGSGNVMSVQRALEYCGSDVIVTDDVAKIANADRLILPGVGAFARCMGALNSLGIADALRAYALTGRPLLGICVGMQILFDSGEEFGTYAGLGLLPGRVSPIPSVSADGTPLKIPHIGWGQLVLPEGRNGWQGTLLSDVEPGASTYFVHSFGAVPANSTDRLADCDYRGVKLSAAVQHNNICGTQFHPEKSGPVGLTIIKRFLEMC